MSPGKSGLCPGPGHLIWESVPFSLWDLMNSHSQQVVTLSWWDMLRNRMTLKVRCQFQKFYIHLLWDLSEILHISRSVWDLILRSQKSVILLFYFSIVKCETRPHHPKYIIMLQRFVCVCQNYLHGSHFGLALLTTSWDTRLNKV